jgi:hypothetical protein
MQAAVGHQVEDGRPRRERRHEHQRYAVRLAHHRELRPARQLDLLFLERGVIAHRGDAVGVDDLVRRLLGPHHRAGQKDPVEGVVGDFHHALVEREPLIDDLSDDAHESPRLA